MTDIKDHIKKVSANFIPRPLVRLLNLSIDKKILPEDIISVLNDDRELSDLLIQKINPVGEDSDLSSIENVLEIYGPEKCIFIILNSFLKLLCGDKIGNKTAERLYEMQLFTACSSFIIAKDSGISYPHIAYYSGLFSNISYFYLSRHFPDKLIRIFSKDMSNVSRMTYEWESFGLDHSEISYLILGSSGINPEIYDPVRSHHQKNIIIDQDNNDTVKNIALAVYSGSMLTNIFYDDLGLATEFRKEVRSLTGLSSSRLECTVDSIIDLFKEMASLNSVTDLCFPGYFKVISWFDTKLALVRSEVQMAKKENSDLYLQNSKYQKILEDNSKKLVGIALTDPLTGAYNRRYLDERLRDEFQKAKRYNQGFVLISCDIDHFKRINDTYGHAFGDTVLIKIVQIIKSALRKTDFISRTGGEEFLAVCHSSNELGGIIIAEKIRKSIENTEFVCGDKKVPVTMSFGVVLYFPEVKSVDELIRISDERLYAAKNAGRNKVVFK